MKPRFEQGKVSLMHVLLLVAVAIAVVWLVQRTTPSEILNELRVGGVFNRFALVFALFVLAPRLFERFHLPGALGLMIIGVLLGPYALEVGKPDSPLLELFSTLGRLFLMFLAGLEVDLRVFEQQKNRSLGFGFLTFIIPLLAGMSVGLAFDFNWVSAMVVGSLIASHTLLAFPIMVQLGIVQRQAITVALGATIFTDVASLLVLAVGISTFQGGFSVSGLLVQLTQLSVYGVLVLVGIPYVGARFFRKHRHDEFLTFAFVFLALLFAAVAASLIHLEDIVGAFFAGLAVNRLVAHTPVQDKLHFIGTMLFIPAFFAAIGMRLDLPVFTATLQNSLDFVVAIVLALLVGKWLAAWASGKMFGFSRAATATVWSLSIPQVAATLAAAMAAYETTNEYGDRLITEPVLNSVIVLMVLTSALGPILSQKFGHQLAAEGEAKNET